MIEPNMFNYEESYSPFSWERPDKYNFATDVIDRWAEQDPAKLAMWWIDDDGGEVKKTFAEIATSLLAANLIFEMLCSMPGCIRRD